MNDHDSEADIYSIHLHFEKPLLHKNPLYQNGIEIPPLVLCNKIPGNVNLRQLFTAK